MPNLENHYFVTHGGISDLGKYHQWLLKPWDENLREPDILTVTKYHIRDYLLIGRGKPIFTKERSSDHHLN